MVGWQARGVWSSDRRDGGGEKHGGRRLRQREDQAARRDRELRSTVDTHRNAASVAHCETESVSH